MDEQGDIYLALSGVKEARLVLKELRLQKRELSAEKRLVTQEMTSIRREYSAKNVRRVPTIRGGGQVGMVMRAFDQAGRSKDRDNREDDLAPLEQEKRNYEAAITMIDQAIHQCDIYILRQKVIEGTEQPNSVARPENSTGTLCTNCGAALEPDHRFCDQCGLRVEE
jgi:hypothetical protein